MAMFSRLLMGAAAIALLAGCNTVNRVSGSVDPGFGEAVKYDQAIQTIDPDPVYTEADAKPGDHGEHGANAVKRYRSDRVKPVERMGTTSGSTGGSGGGPQ
jgi:hypothetical protein